MPDTDPAVSALDEERAILAAAADAADQREWRVATQIYGTLKVPALIAAAEAALAFHEESGGSCGSCLDAYGDRIEWPCEEYRAITAALAGKQLSEDGNHGRPA